MVDFRWLICQWPNEFFIFIHVLTFLWFQDRLVVRVWVILWLEWELWQGWWQALFFSAFRNGQCALGLQTSDFEPFNELIWLIRLGQLFSFSVISYIFILFTCAGVLRWRLIVSVWIWGLQFETNWPVYRILADFHIFHTWKSTVNRCYYLYLFFLRLCTPLILYLLSLIFTDLPLEWA